MDVTAKVPKDKDKSKSLKKAVGELKLKAETPEEIAILTVLFNEWLSPFSSNSVPPNWLILLYQAINKNENKDEEEMEDQYTDQEWSELKRWEKE